MADDQPNHDALITQLAGLTGIAPREAQNYLAANQWDLSSAAAEYYTSLEEATVQASPSPRDNNADSDDEDPHSAVASATESTPQPIPTTSRMPPPPSSSSREPPKKKFATLGDLGGGGGASHAGHGHNDDDDDDDDDTPDQDLFAGGEKSGLAVHNPDDLKKKIFDRAKKNIPRPGGDEPRAPTSRFTGTARTLGGDDKPSEIIEDPNAAKPRAIPRVKRVLHFWEDGFSVDDGPLYRTDDPANADTLRLIRSGSAPQALMNVERGQEVDVQLEPHSEKYQQPKKKYKPFSGGGQRLGSPTPGPQTSSEEPNQSPATAASTATTSTGPVAPAVEVNDSEPTISLQIRLGDGTRLLSRFNVTHTIGDVYSFVAAATSSNRDRAWVLMTTFPSKELQDKAQALGDLAEFRRGGVVVQKWV
ncbi:hypothetical protein MMC07_005623 [Pseudocyphellaria aurata]|nr:hypothetical protein [Pseudocyphellaria aurata]